MKTGKRIVFLSFLTMVFILSGCVGGAEGGGQNGSVEGNGGPSVQAPIDEKPKRDNTPVVLEPRASQEKVVGNEKIIFDISNAGDGYIMARYTGDNPKVKVRIKNPGEETLYTYDMAPGYNVFPLTGGSGAYTLSAFERITGDKYSSLYSTAIEVGIENELLPYLYPNQYVNFNASTRAVQLGSELVKNAENDLDAVKCIYDYVVNNISYDDGKADLVKAGKLSGYLPAVDEVLNEKRGICFDYSALMATMLRTQNIPTRMVLGYVSISGDSVYHAWISVYIKDVGWIDDLIRFDGQNWSMIDPTLISDGHNSPEVRELTSNQNNYIDHYKY